MDEVLHAERLGGRTKRLHRHNIDHVGEILALAERLGAQYVELANTQYYGWAWLNRAELLPSRAQLERAEAVTNEFRARVGKRMQIYFVVPDYYAGYVGLKHRQRPYLEVCIFRVVANRGR